MIYFQFFVNLPVFEGLKMLSTGTLLNFFSACVVCGADQDGLVYVIPGIPAETQELTQTGATWGLDRIDSPTGLDGDYNFDQTGAGVTVFCSRRWSSSVSSRIHGTISGV